MHLALQHLFGLANDERTLEPLAGLERATSELRSDPEYRDLELDAEAEAVFLAEAEELVRRYFELEDPTTINPIGIELMLEARVGDLRLRGLHRPLGVGWRRRGRGHRLQDGACADRAV